MNTDTKKKLRLADFRNSIKSFLPERRYLIIFLYWFLPVFLFRCIFLLKEIKLEMAAYRIYIFFTGILWGVFQDIFIVAQAFLFLYMLACIIPNKIWKVISSVFMSFFLVYYLFDLFLVLKTGIHMNFSFLYFFRDWKVFLDSVGNGMLTVLLFSAVILIIYSFFVMLYYKSVKKAEGIKYSAFFLVFSLILIIFTKYLIPFHLINICSNSLFAEEMRLIYSMVPVHGADSTIPEKNGKSLFNSIKSKNEIFTQQSKKSVFFTKSTGFKGKKNFEVKVKAGEKPHLIFYVMESFRARDIGVLGGDAEVSPEFDRLAGEGVLFRRFYANGVQTSRSVVSMLFGVFPRFTRQSVQAHPGVLRLYGLPQILSKHGYSNAYLHNGSLAFEDKEGFFPRFGFNKIQGMEELCKKYPQAEKSSWGIEDKYLVDHAVDYLLDCERRKQLTFSIIFTVTHHHPWKKPSGFKVPVLKNRAGRGQYARFLETFYYSDYCLGLFVDKLRKTGLAKKSILFILADTAQPMGEHFGNHMLLEHIYEENCRIPLLILADGRLEHPVVLDEVGSQIDLLPTVLDIMGYSGWNHGFGSSLVRKDENRIAFVSSPFSYRYFSIINQQYKYINTLDIRKSSLFNLKDDPEETVDIALKKTDLIKKLEKEAIFRYKASRHMYEYNEFLPADFKP